MNFVNPTPPVTTPAVNQFCVIIPAGGSSTRFGGGQNKLLQPLAGSTVLQRTLQAFTSRSDVPLIVVATQMDDSAWSGLDATQRAKISRCPGGPSRAQSVLNALTHVPPSIDWVAVHDAARPLVSQPLIDSVFQMAVLHGAAVPALPVALTIKQADGPLPARVRLTIPRNTLWAMQTPQVMRRQALLDAFHGSPISLQEITDDAQLLELANQEVWLVPGEERNLKVTTPQDLLLAEMFLK